MGPGRVYAMARQGGRDRLDLTLGWHHRRRPGHRLLLGQGDSYVGAIMVRVARQVLAGRSHAEIDVRICSCRSCAPAGACGAWRDGAAPRFAPAWDNLANAVAVDS